MAALYAIWKRLSHLRLDGVHYDICVKEREDGRFSVAWVCLQCCEQGPPIPATETVDRAVSFAYIGLRAHHGLIHSELRQQLSLSERPLIEESGPGLDEAASHRRREAYEQLRAAFETLIEANAKIRSYNVAATTKEAISGFAAACRGWNDAACEFDAALEAYSTQLCNRARAIESDLHDWRGAKSRKTSATPPRRCPK